MRIRIAIKRYGNTYINMGTKGTPSEMPREAYYTQEGLAQRGLTDLMVQFERKFREYLEGVQTKLVEIVTTAIDRRAITDEEIGILRDAHNRIGTFQYPYASQVGNIEATWTAAHELRERYDCAVGNAVKGLWLSYIFDLVGWDVTNILTKRMNSDTLRKVAPIEHITESLEGKRILLLENDVMTGATLEAAGRFLRTVMRCATVDVLLLLDYSILESHEWRKARKVIDRRLVRGKISIPNVQRDEEGRFVTTGPREIRIIDPPDKVPWIREIGSVKPFRPPRFDVPDLGKLYEVKRRLVMR
ncbi:MAG: hypothetical protein ABH842_03795 [Candidatus Micrarchaeota archaeon]